MRCCVVRGCKPTEHATLNSAQQLNMPLVYYDALQPFINALSIGSFYSLRPLAGHGSLLVCGITLSHGDLMRLPPTLAVFDLGVIGH